MAMNPWVFGIEIKPDQMPASNAILILIFIPLFNRFVYPLSYYLPTALQFHNRPLRKMGLGMFLCGCSFVISAFLQFAVEKNPYHPDDKSTGICILWQLLQYIVVTASEIMFSITGLEFAYGESPISLKSMAQAGWLLTVAVGNLIVVVIAESKLFESLAHEMLFFAVMIWLALLVFSYIAYNYTPLKLREDEELVFHDDE